MPYEASDVVESSLDSDEETPSNGAEQNSPKPAPVNIQSATPRKLAENVNDKPKKAASAGIRSDINVLATTDLANVVGAGDFMLLCQSLPRDAYRCSSESIYRTVINAPMLVGLSIWFLHRIFGWAAFVGLAVMVFLSPLPGLVAGMIQRAQITRMLKVGNYSTFRIYLIMRRLMLESKSFQKVRGSSYGTRKKYLMD